MSGCIWIYTQHMYICAPTVFCSLYKHTYMCMHTSGCIEFTCNTYIWVRLLHSATCISVHTHVCTHACAVSNTHITHIHRCGVSAAFCCLYKYTRTCMHTRICGFKWIHTQHIYIGVPAIFCYMYKYTHTCMHTHTSRFQMNTHTTQHITYTLNIHTPIYSCVVCIIYICVTYIHTGVPTVFQLGLSYTCICIINTTHM